MLEFIWGVEGTGKTTAVLEQLKKLSDEGRKALLIVPEQFTFETEHTIYKKLGAKGTALITVVSFSKLADSIVALFGSPKAYADDIVKELLMYRAVKALSFKYYAGQAGGADFPSKMLGLVADIKAAGYSAERFRKQTDKLNDAMKGLKDRLSDIAAVYTAYDGMLGKEFADRLDNVRLAAELIEESPQSITAAGVPLSEARIYLDGFDSFNGSEWLLLHALLSAAATLTITVCTDSIESTQPEYISENDIIRRLTEKLTDYSVKEHSTECKNAARKPKNVYFSAAEDVYAECEEIAARIREKVMDEHCRYSDIAVILRDDSYLAPLESKLKSYEISGFVDLPQSILSKPLVNFSLLALKASTFEGNSVLKYIKSRFVRVPVALSKSAFLGHHRRKKISKPTALKKVKAANRIKLLYNKKTVTLPRSVIDRFEKLAALYGLSGDGWKEPILHDRELEGYRLYLSDSLSALAKATANTTGDKITEALCDFLIEKNQIQAAVSALCNKNNLFAKGFSMDETLRDEYRRLWELMITVFESFHEGLKDVPVTVPEYLGLLTRAFSKVRFSKAPTVLDAITVGDPERSRISGKKHVFIAGFSQGIYPAPTVPKCEFSGEELEQLSNSGLELYETRMPRYYRERFIINRALNLASDCLYLSSAGRSVGCLPVEPSALLDKIKPTPAPKSKWLYSTVASAKSRYAEIFTSQNDIDEANALRELLESSGCADYVKALSSARDYDGSYSGRIDAKVSEKLYDKDAAFSPSAIEALCGCSFKYFCSYVLGISPNQTIEMDSRTIGNVVHHCLEQTISEYIANPDDFSGDAFINNDDRDEASINALRNKLDGYMKDYRQNSLGGKYLKSKSFDGIYEALKPGILALLVRTLREIAHSDFKPKETEHIVSGTLGEVKLKGKLDRLDVMNSGDKKYIRVIDYKTGNKDFSLPLVYYGLDLQMLLYLFLSCDNDKDGNTLPSGTAYYRAGGIFCDKVNSDKAGEETFNRRWYDNHRVSGMLLRTEPNGKDTKLREDEEAVGKLLDYYKSDKCGDNSRKKFIVNAGVLISDYSALKDYCTKHIEKKVKALLSGEVAENPVRAQEADPCHYCDYIELCKSKGSEYTKIDKKEIFNIITDVAQKEKEIKEMEKEAKKTK